MKGKCHGPSLKKNKNTAYSAYFCQQKYKLKKVFRFCLSALQANTYRVDISYCSLWKSSKLEKIDITAKTQIYDVK